MSGQDQEEGCHMRPAAVRLGQLAWRAGRGSQRYPGDWSASAAPSGGSVFYEMSCS